MAPPTAPRPLTPGLGLHRFRGDIQGLRAVAVLAVLVFHAGVTAVPGGFVGVDVFFVISGFLITGLLLKEVDRTGRVALTEFYARRARRILPAALVVLVLTLAAGMLVMPAGEWARLGATAVASALSVVNWLFAAESTDYFAQEEAASPYQHYWSLAVEEQFYLFWPLLVVLVTVGAAALIRRGRRSDAAASGPVRRRPSAPVAARRVLLTAGVLGLASFVHSAVHSSTDPGAAYFVTTTRVWELALGAALAAALVVLPVIPAAVRAGLGWVGLAMIAVALVAISGEAAYPGVVAAVPVAGSALVILAGAHEDGSTAWHPARLLATRPMQWIGDLSYSLYLVHWPVLTLAAWRFPDARLPLWLGLTLALASVGLAWLLRRAVELPALHGPVLAGRRRALTRGGVGMAASAALGALVLTAGVAAVPQRPGTDVQVAGAQAPASGEDPMAALAGGGRMVPAPAVADDDRSPAHLEGCQLGYTDVEPRACEFGDPDAETVILLLGDSHASQWTAPLEVLAEERDWRVVSHTKASCGVSTAVTEHDGEEYTACGEWNERLPGVAERLRPDLVLVTAASHDTLSGPSYEEGMAEAWRRLAPHAGRLAVVQDSPWAGLNVPRCLEQNPDDPAACAYDRAEAIADSGAPELTAAAGRDPAWDVIDLTHLICPGEGECAPVVGEAVVFFDSNHLTATFARTLAPQLGEEIAALLR
ncbi:acyltransferase family protein [Micrococcus sp.]|uniref:acyltransferase family protein n=1 Tax=Micrococcus sp. TaxID=1271 RepID=UPI0026DD6083|nr:acyltransferase family protein [Micrococcus sp.]MDO4240563.1 acyltransferase family protein [Micrococcus sp.]